ncbi:hypothetical protein VPH35_056046 [Triticum aestivum]|uniref:Uncharacterized protein n=1 Tax=Triticum aestivum TaxID=4565 RepID=A0A077RUB3_WHEAT|nr:unnamed protein product [Triticum aestivum]
MLVREEVGEKERRRGAHRARLRCWLVRRSRWTERKQGVVRRPARAGAASGGRREQERGRRRRTRARSRRGRGSGAGGGGLDRSRGRRRRDFFPDGNLATRGNRGEAYWWAPERTGPNRFVVVDRRTVLCIKRSAALTLAPEHHESSRRREEERRRQGRRCRSTTSRVGKTCLLVPFLHKEFHPVLDFNIDIECGDKMITIDNKPAKLHPDPP